MRVRFLFAPMLLLFPILDPAPAGAQTAVPADDLRLVDCRLPSKQRRIGGRTYAMPPRAVRTTARYCHIRGGDYLVDDRGSYETSLKFWLAEAEKGSSDAKYYVGKIYEDGLGRDPDDAAAAEWYAKAAADGHTAAQFSLASMYERGAGVAVDREKAFALYRKALGLPDDIVLVDRGALAAMEQAAEELLLREQEIEELQRQLDAARGQQQRDEERERVLLQQLDEEKGIAESHRKEKARLIEQVRLLEKAAAAAAVRPPPRGGLGRFVALVIGNSRYEHLDPLPSAERDARAMEAVLRDAYGFEVKVLLNATRVQIVSALVELMQSLEENDNLLVFYAGRGKRDPRNRRGWWLPVDAGPDEPARRNWLQNGEVSDYLSEVPARHILVIADGSYVGDLTRGAPQVDEQSLSASEYKAWVATNRRKRARLALASGADGPVPAGGGAGSRFTATLIDLLRRQKSVFPAWRLHQQLVLALPADQSAVPTLAPLRTAFHEGAEFLFERKPGS